MAINEPEQNTFNQYQYDDLVARQDDVYAASKYQIIADYLRGQGKLKILNAGCGSGELSFLLARQGHKLVGIDPDPRYIALANKSRAKLGIRENCSFLVNSIEDYVNQDLYDCVIATDVLEHIADDQRAGAKLAGFLRPGGLLIITVPAMQSLFGFHDESLGHFRRYSKSRLTKLIESTDLTIKKIRYFGFTLIPILILYSKILRKPYPVASSGKGAGHALRQVILIPMLAIDRDLPMPLGTSLICMAQKL